MEGKKTSRQRRRNLRRENQFHRGGSKGGRKPERENSVHSRREGKVRRDRNQSVNQLGIVFKRIQQRKREKRKRIVVGTSPELGRLRERTRKEGKDPKRQVVTRGWVSGILTNRRRQEKERTGGELPSLIVFRHPNDHGVGRKEARRCGIPTVGIADSDCEYMESLTYPIPGNDESRGGQRRRRRRIQNRWMGKENNAKKTKKNETM